MPFQGTHYIIYIATDSRTQSVYKIGTTETVLYIKTDKERIIYYRDTADIVLISLTIKLTANGIQLI